MLRIIFYIALFTLFFCVKGQAQLHSAPSCGANIPVSLNWGTSTGEVNWTPTGNLTYSAVNVGDSGHTFTYTFSGNTAALASLSPYVSKELSTPDALTLYTSGLASGAITLTIDISPAISGEVGMSFFHINGSAGSGGDKFTVYATNGGGAPIYPTFTDDTSPAYSSNSSGVLDATGTGSGDTAGANWSTATIDQITIIWDDCGVCGSGFHGTAISGIDFCASSVCAPNAGSFSGLGGCNFIESSAVEITHNNDHNSNASYTQSYALTNASGVIQSISTTPSFGILAVGNYQVYAINYETSGGISNYSIGNNMSTVAGSCLQITNNSFQVCSCDYTNGQPIVFSAAGGDINTGSATTQYALTNSGGEILAIASNAVLPGQSEGIYYVYAVTYDTASGISNLIIGNNISTVTSSCFDVSVSLNIGVCGTIPKCARYESITQN